MPVTSTPTTKSLSEAEALELVGKAFPSSTVGYQESPRPDPEMARRHYEMLWGSEPGWAYLAWATGPHWQDGTYRHSSWRPRLLRWPGQIDALARLAARMAVTGDVYIAPLLRSQRRTATTVDGEPNLLPGRWCWADVDGEWTEAREEWLGRLGRAARVLRSGQGSHVYVRLSRTVEPERLGELNRRLAAALEADCKWSPAALLRLAGTLNWKTLPPAPVRWDR